jgi:spermidine synthase
LDKRNHYRFNPIRKPLVDFTHKVNKYNITFGPWVTSVDEDYFSPHTVYTVIYKNFVLFNNVTEFNQTMQEIVEFNDADIEFSEIQISDKVFRADFELDKKTEITIRLEGDSLKVVFDVKYKHFNVFNAIAMVGHVFKTYDYEIKQEIKQLIKKQKMEAYPNYKKGDLVAFESGERAFTHNAKILEYKKSMYQKAIFFQAENLGIGLILDKSIQFFENTFNYTDFFYSRVIQTKPKNILIIGGGDLIILKRIAESPEFNDIDKITLVDVDQVVVDLSKKYLYPNIDKWLNNKKIEIIIGDGNKYVLDLPYNHKIDMVIMDTTSPEAFQDMKLFQMDYFNKLNDIHLNPNGMILLHTGYVSEDGSAVQSESEFPKFVKIFDYFTESVYTPEYTGHMMFYVLTKKNKTKQENLKDEL